MTKEIEEIKQKKKIIKGNNSNHSLVLINDDVHSFDYVIEVLMAVCNHTFEQASQCAMITHYKGKCDIKNGPIGKLRSMKSELTECELKAVIN